MLKVGIVLSMALVCGAVLGGAATYAYAGWYADLLEYATFNSDTNELTIYLKKEIDPLFIDMEEIRVGSCGPSICTFVNLSVDEPILVSDNRKSVVITLTTAQQDAMSRTIPIVKLDIGAFKSPGGGSRNEPEQAPIVMPGEKPASLLERAEYVVDSNNLVLYLKDKIDPSSLEPTYIHIQVYIPDGDYNLVESTRLSNDRKSITIIPTEILKNELLTTRDPTILLLIGTYRSESDGIVNGRETAQIVIRGNQLPLPTHIKFLESAAYNSKTGELVLRFHDLIDVSSINMERIELVGSHDATGRPLSDYGFRWDDASGLRAFFVHDASMRHALLAVENLSVRLDVGAYQSYDNGVSNGVEETPVEILGQPALERVVYAVASNELVLHFAEKVSPVDTNYLPITIRDGCCRGIGSLGVQDVRSGDDKRSIIYHLDIDSKNDLLTAVDPGMRLFPGVYKIDATGFGNGLETVPVTINWENAVLEPTLLDRAEYVIASNELTLFFTDEVNPLYADDLPITVWYGCCYSSDLEILHFRTGDDRRSIVYYPDIFSRSGLLTFKDDLRAQLLQGVVRVHVI